MDLDLQQPQEDSTIDRLLEEDTGLLNSRLGKRIILFMMLAGLIPLFVFAGPLYWQSLGLMEDEARESLQNYSQMTGGQLFQTLKQGEHRLARLAATLDEPPEPRERQYFSEFHIVDEPDELQQFSFARSRPLVGEWDVVSKFQAVQNRPDQEVLLSPAYQTDDEVTVALITAGPGGIWVGEVRPEILWEPLRGSLFGPRDLAVVVDEHERLLSKSQASSLRLLSPLSDYFSGVIPRGESAHGQAELEGLEDVFWVSSQIWLEGAFGSGSWQLIIFREQGAVTAVPLQLLYGLGIWFALAFFGLILIAFRFSRNLFNPIEQLIEATRRIGMGDWSTQVSIDTNDELELLSNSFNEMLDTIRRTNQRLQHNATHDDLTGLPNRALLEERIQHAINFADRHKEYSFAMIFIDLDRFKVINDSLGHSVGDKLLRLLAERLEENLRKEDTVARLSGDEFIILVESVRTLDQVDEVVSKVLSVIERPYSIEGQQVSIGASIGIVMHDEDYRTAEEMLQDADTAMYRAKNQQDLEESYVVFGRLMRDEVRGKFDIELDLKQALDKSQFDLRYQPIINFRTGEIAGAEALLRWEHPEKGFISPTQFIPIAEETGTIHEIGRWVLQTGCYQLARWKQAYGEDMGWLSINLSSRQLFYQSLIDDIVGVVKRNAIQPGWLKVEVTENVFISNTARAVEILKLLQERGIAICMDDFGTGHSSMALLCDLPIEILKIDRTFTSGVTRNNDQKAVVSSVARLASEMGLELVAEGLEEVEDIEFLVSLGCEFGQGYYFARPLDNEGYEDLFTNWEPKPFSRDAGAGQ